MEWSAICVLSVGIAECRSTAPDIRGTKADRLLALNPDVAVIQECSDTAAIDEMVRVNWRGHYPRNGLAVFARAGLEVRPEMIPAQANQWCLRVHVGSADLDVVAVWGFNKAGKAGPPRDVALEAIGALNLSPSDRAVIVGDFNDGPQFDAGERESFAKTWRALESSGYRSAYHHASGAVYGHEDVSTFSQGKEIPRLFLIDHAFVSRDLVDGVTGFAIGDWATWREISDHVPLTLDLQL